MKRIEIGDGFAVVRDGKAIRLENPLGLKFMWHAPKRSQINRYQTLAVQFATILHQASKIPPPLGFALRTVEERPAREGGFHSPRRKSKAERATDSRIGEASWLLHPIGEWTAVFVPEKLVGSVGDTHPHI